MLSALLISLLTALSVHADEILVKEGVYTPFFRDTGELDERVQSLYVDRGAVSNRQFLEFVRAHPEWKRSATKAVFAGPGYLEQWRDDESFAKKLADRPVTNISWFAARKFCESRGKRLLTTAEWEYVSDAQNPRNLSIILEWYGRPEDETAPKPATNRFGLVGMHGDIWEWVEDFASAIIAGDSRSQSENSKSMFCGGGALKAKDPAQYATFMRFAHRSSLRANSVGRTLGFRCARYAKKGI
jgi:formylglycine-generating enzyme required for sulfatase activity